MTNIVLLVGNLGADPELHSTNGGTDIATFNLGTSRPKRDGEGKIVDVRDSVMRTSKRWRSSLFMRPIWHCAARQASSEIAAIESPDLLFALRAFDMTISRNELDLGEAECRQRTISERSCVPGFAGQRSAARRKSSSTRASFTELSEAIQVRATRCRHVVM